MARPDRPFSPEELHSIEDAVRNAEQDGGGEIVVFITNASDKYHLAAWKGAAIGSLAMALLATFGFASLDSWDVWIEAWLLAPAGLGAALGYLAGRLATPCRRALIDRDLMEERVERRAAETFLSEEVFATRHRDGVLLYVSLFERRVALLADSGARGAVPQEAWDRLTNVLTQEIRRGRAHDGLLAAVKECGALLASHRAEIGADDQNELDDAPRMGEEA